MRRRGRHDIQTVSLLVLVAIFVAATVLPINMGVLAFAAGFLVGGRLDLVWWSSHACGGGRGLELLIRKPHSQDEFPSVLIASEVRLRFPPRWRTSEAGH